MVIWKLVGGKSINRFFFIQYELLFTTSRSLSKKFSTLCTNNTNNNLTLIDMHSVFISIDPICNTLLIMQYINSYEIFQL